MAPSAKLNLMARGTVTIAENNPPALTLASGAQTSSAPVRSSRCHLAYNTKERAHIAAAASPRPDSEYISAASSSAVPGLSSGVRRG